VKYLRTIVLSIVLLCLSRAAQAQGHDAHWIFGNGYHLRFDETGPTVLPFIDDFYAFEGASCISDKTGDLLFYSNTIRVWNREFLPLFNSDTFPALDVPPSSSKTNGSMFLPWPGDTAGRFFAFFAINDADDKLYLSKIDKTLDSGLGGVVEDCKYKLVWEFEISEQLCAVKHGNGEDWWIIVRKGSVTSSEFIISLFTSEGLGNTLVESSGFEGGFAGELTADLSGTKLALATTYGPVLPTLAVYEFNRCSGLVELIDTILTLNGSNFSYGISFSSDGSKIYYTTIEKTKLYQLSLFEGVLYDSLIFRYAGSDHLYFNGSALQHGSNGKIYMNYRKATLSGGFDGLSDHLGVINFPNLPGKLCQFDTFGVYLNGRESTTYSLPNFPNYDLGPLIGSPCDTLSPVDTTQTNVPVLPQGTTTWSVVPTISDGLFAIQGAANGTLMVYDLYGREVFRKSLTNAPSFDLSAFPAGLYWVTVQSEDGIWYPAQKIIRQ